MHDRDPRGEEKCGARPTFAVNRAAYLEGDLPHHLVDWPHRHRATRHANTVFTLLNLHLTSINLHLLRRGGVEDHRGMPYGHAGSIEKGFVSLDAAKMVGAVMHSLEVEPESDAAVPRRGRFRLSASGGRRRGR
ncbi:hypothetical protein MMAGJ_39060 [Mycolicibacterium mageritense]|uniref:Uncharacterized protein n=1 Tax=Mycolicibacterium mageritense TaxID=53462 RepID=A0ABM7HVJ9_MYCME|nr:hypothetical protein MMAGJ_39060 [Mycolicibacterium mageritense]